jgi:hypothetical protein
VGADFVTACLPPVSSSFLLPWDPSVHVFVLPGKAWGQWDRSSVHVG